MTETSVGEVCPLVRIKFLLLAVIVVFDCYTLNVLVVLVREYFKFSFELSKRVTEKLRLSP